MPGRAGRGRSRLAGGARADGAELVRPHWAAGRHYRGRRSALSSGKYAPALKNVEPQQIYSAMISGPQSMPRFSDRQLTPQDKRDIIAYVHSVTDEPNNPGGYSLGGFGPVPEGMISWIVGITALVGVTLWIGSKA